MTGAALLLLALPAVLVAGFLATRVAASGPRLRGRRGSLPARRVTGAVLVSVGAAIAVATVLASSGSANLFALSGAQRYITAPIVYGSFAIVVVGCARSYTRMWPFWTVGLLGLTLIGLLFGLYSGVTLAAGTIVQGLVLFGGAVLFAAAGLAEAEWNAVDRRDLMVVLLGSGAFAGIVGVATGVFSALVVPAGVALLLAVRDRMRGWPLLVAAGAGTLVAVQARTVGAIDPSAAASGQLVVAGALVALALLPKRLRLPLVLVGLIAVLPAALTSDVPGLFFGVGADLKDVTLAQRAYETQQVAAQVAANPFGLLFGAGPGGTVDLSASPDASTLASSGRTLAAVPSVHLITSYFLLKGGVLGLAWLLVFVVAALVATVRVLREPRPAFFDVALTLFVWCGIVQAAPAATFLLSNPLPTLLLAVLHVRQHAAPAGAARVPGLRLAAVQPASRGTA